MMYDTISSNLLTDANLQLSQLLPESSFVEFDAHKLKNHRVVWSNPHNAPSFKLDDYAYCTPLASDSAKDYLDETKRYKADRYGGVGIGPNGGGARCGLIGGVQVKGIGRNQLAGTETPFWHSYGGETVAGGVREAIWGEICHFSLPYGGVRVHGIIDTGTSVPLFEANGNGEVTRRGLTLREAAIRPGHFVRSLFFSRKDEKLRQLCSDSERTRRAIFCLGDTFQSTFGGNESNALNSSYINTCLKLMFSRFATQIAVGNVKRIIHGAINASNICLDGKWIDFGTISTISDYGRIIINNTGPDVWEHSRVIKVASELIVSLRKYLPHTLASKIIPLGELSNHFHIEFKKRVRIEFLKLTGIPECRLAKIDEKSQLAFYDCIQKIISSGNKEPFKLYHPCPFYVAHMPDKMGDFHLNTIMKIVATCRNAEEADRRLSIELTNQSLRKEFIFTFWNIKNAFLAQFNSTSIRNAWCFMAINCLRVNMNIPELYRHTLDKAINNFLISESDASLFINPLVNKAKTLLMDPVDRTLDLSDWFLGRATLSLDTGFVINGSPIDFQIGVKKIKSGILSANQIKELLVYGN